MDIGELATRNVNGIVLIVILILCLVALSLQNSRITEASERLGMGLNVSITMALNNLKNFFSNTVSSIARLRELRNEYNQLLTQLEQRQTTLRDIEALERENSYLRELLDYPPSLEYDHLPAQIVGKDPGVFFSSLIIDKGNRHGITVGMPVVAFQDDKEGLVGRVVEISWNSAIVRPLLDPQNFVSGRLRKTRYEGLLKGLGTESGLLIMEYLDRRSKNQISVGDEVISSGLQSLYPPNILVGTVAAISAPSHSISLELEIDPFIDFTRLEHVFVLLSNGTGP